MRAPRARRRGCGRARPAGCGGLAEALEGGDDRVEGGGPEQDGERIGFSSDIEGTKAPLESTFGLGEISSRSIQLPARACLLLSELSRTPLESNHPLFRPRQTALERVELEEHSMRPHLERCVIRSERFGIREKGCGVVRPRHCPERERAQRGQAGGRKASRTPLPTGSHEPGTLTGCCEGAFRLRAVEKPC
jgi:hypothetical protein